MTSSEKERFFGHEEKSFNSPKLKSNFHEASFSSNNEKVRHIHWKGASVPMVPVSQLPKSVDWRLKNVITPVKSQSCG